MGPALPPAFLKGHIAHRGLHGPGVPENSLAAYAAAVEIGVGIELDIQPSADGAAMTFHDDVLDRLTGEAGPVAERDAKALAGIALTGGTGGIPRLGEALDLVAGRVPLLIEVKDQDGAMGPNVGPLEDAVIAALDGYAGDVAVMSFNPHSVACFRDRAPHLPRGLVTARFDAKHWPGLPEATRARLRGIPDFEPLGCSFISHQGNALDMARVLELKAAGAAILCWTIRTREQERIVRQIADAVTFESYLP
ncbi:glycerophosphodiester phosphodiesterase family protein [Jannaschia marina]|uniref:glycerophosphodiester phosphodiesterase family protein n=1 Tax=Jannaschia marina TaxID=2741674 RepID=UPI0015CCB6D9|nr:glycerophosphodiester phosphodiesterase family protein [Jannaschia marina]